MPATPSDPPARLGWAVVVPVKRLELAKTRLTQYAGDHRERLASAFAADTVAAALACPAVAGVLVGLAFGQITPFMGVDIGLKGIAAMVLGGLGNVRATALGGLVLGITEVLSVAYVSSSYRDVIVYGSLIVMLLIRPQGLLGRTIQVERL